MRVKRWPRKMGLLQKIVLLVFIGKKEKPEIVPAIAGIAIPKCSIVSVVE